MHDDDNMEEYDEKQLLKIAEAYLAKVAIPAKANTAVGQTNEGMWIATVDGSAICLVESLAELVAILAGTSNGVRIMYVSTLRHDSQQMRSGESGGYHDPNMNQFLGAGGFMMRWQEEQQ